MFTFCTREFEFAVLLVFSLVGDKLRWGCVSKDHI